MGDGIDGGGQSTHSRNTSMAMRRMAKSNRCPKCGRKSALKTQHNFDFGYTLRYCRWNGCGYERTIRTDEIDK